MPLAPLCPACGRAIAYGSLLGGGSASAACSTSPRLRGEVDLRAEPWRSEANRVRGLVHKLRLAATPPHPDSFAALGIRPLPARGERWRKWLFLAPQDTNSKFDSPAACGERSEPPHQPPALRPGGSLRSQVDPGSSPGQALSPQAGRGGSKWLAVRELHLPSPGAQVRTCLPSSRGGRRARGRAFWEPTTLRATGARGRGRARRCRAPDAPGRGPRPRSRPTNRRAARRGRRG